MRRLTTPLLALAVLGCAGAPPTSRTEPAAASRARREPAAAEPRRDDLQHRYADRPALATLRGHASYYSDRLAGRHTANGDVYDPRAFTAANRELPFGTILRVVREDTGASVIVRVNDRGPFRDRARILDLSRAAAEALDMIHAGVVDVRAEVLERPRR